MERIIDQNKIDEALRNMTDDDVKGLLLKRGEVYGEFQGHAELSQSLKAVMISAPKWALLSFEMREALEMVQHKIARILNGDCNYKDSWVDIEGYVKLVTQKL